MARPPSCARHNILQQGPLVSAYERAFAPKSSWNDAFCLGCGLSATGHLSRPAKIVVEVPLTVWADTQANQEFCDLVASPSRTWNLWRRAAECRRSVLFSQHDGDHAL